MTAFAGHSGACTGGAASGAVAVVAYHNYCLVLSW